MYMSYIFSYIIPVYNSEKYLERCIDSIVSQCSDQVEVILVNDGSTDQSAAICQKYVDRFSFIKLVSKENEGQGIARGFGVQHASGDYILFADSDDYIVNNTIATIAKYVCDTSVAPDVLEFGYRTVSDDLDEVIESFSLQTYFAEMNILEHFVKFGGRSSLWNKAYKRHLFDNVVHLPYRHLEDRALNVQLLAKAKSMLTIPDVLYNYCVHGNSTVRAAYSERKIDSVRSSIFISEFVKSINTQLFDYCLYDVCAQAVLNYCALQNSMLKTKTELSSYLVSAFHNSKKLITEIQLPKKAASRNRRLMITLFSISPRLCSSVYRTLISDSDAHDKLVVRGIHKNSRASFKTANK